MSPRLWRHLTVAAACTLAAGCPRNPATGTRQLNFISPEKEIALGQESAEEVSASMGLYENEPLQRYVQEVGAKLAESSERPNLPWSFRVVDDTTVNAFALPGGPIFVTRGLLAHLDNEAQLAIVLGHEIGHVTAEHSLNQMSRAQLAEVGVGLSALFSQQLAGLSMSGLQLLFLKNGRDDERESDMLALRYAGRAGYDVRVAPSVFEVLRRVSEASAGERTPGWLATHPDPEERVASMEKKLDKLPPEQRGARVAEEPLKRALDGLVYGEDPREGILRGTHFAHPGLRFSVDFPSGYHVVNARSQVVAQEPEGEAAMELTLSESASPETALSRFFAKSGATPISRPEPLGRAVVAGLRAQTEAGVIGGAVAFLREGHSTFRFLFVAPAQVAARHAPAFRQLVTSFARLDDPALLNAKPRRLRVEALARPTGVRALAAAHPEVSAEELALLNQTTVDATLPAGRLVKWVEAPR